MKKTRLDDLLVSRGLCADKDQALRAVLAHEVRVDGVYPTSAALMVKPDADIFFKAGKEFVSRGGHKLQGALDAFSIDVSGLRCLDIGSSTGGFTDCLLKAGAQEVTCVDVNYGQLAWELRTDARVVVFERTNIKTADPDDLGAPFDMIVIDVSFIGLARLASVLAALAQVHTKLVALVKPQFESHHDETQGGVVTDPAIRMRTVEEVKCALAEVGFALHGSVRSELTGPKGNVEYLIYAIYEGVPALH